MKHSLKFEVLVINIRERGPTCVDSLTVCVVNPRVLNNNSVGTVGVPAIRVCYLGSIRTLHLVRKYLKRVIANLRRLLGACQ